MDFDKVVEKRRSIRSFKGNVVSWKDVLLAIDSARQSPAAGGDLLLKFIIVEDPHTIDKLAKHADQDWISQASVVAVLVSDDKNLEKLYGDKGRVYSRQQSGAVINTLLLKLVDLGLSGCWVGSYDDNKIKDVLDIPKAKQVEAIIPIGYEKPAAKNMGKTRKKPLENFLYWDKWDRSKRQPIFRESQSKADLHGHPY